MKRNSELVKVIVLNMSYVFEHQIFPLLKERYCEKYSHLHIFVRTGQKNVVLTFQRAIFHTLL